MISRRRISNLKEPTSTPVFIIISSLATARETVAFKVLVLDVKGVLKTHQLTEKELLQTKGAELHLHLRDLRRLYIDNPYSAEVRKKEKEGKRKRTSPYTSFFFFFISQAFLLRRIVFWFVSNSLRR
jgi:hypothetical protein